MFVDDYTVVNNSCLSLLNAVNSVQTTLFTISEEVSKDTPDKHVLSSCIASADAFMEAVNSQRILLQTALDEFAADLLK